MIVLGVLVDQSLFTPHFSLLLDNQTIPNWEERKV